MLPKMFPKSCEVFNIRHNRTSVRLSIAEENIIQANLKMRYYLLCFIVSYHTSMLVSDISKYIPTKISRVQLDENNNVIPPN